MQSENRLFEDVARVASGALNALSGIKTETEALIRQQVERLLASMNLVTREEFEVVRAVAAKAREEQESLSLRVAELEALLKLNSGKSAGGAAKIAKSKASGDPLPKG